MPTAPGSQPGPLTSLLKLELNVELKSYIYLELESLIYQVEGAG